jgi:hypothetical protein
MNFKKWVKSIQTAGYNGARMVFTGLKNTLNHGKIQIAAYNGAHKYGIHIWQLMWRVF